MGLSEYLNELLGKKDSSKPINKDFRSVYDDGKMATTIDRVEGSLAKLHAQVANVITVDLSDGEVSSDYSIIKQDGIRGIALCKVEDLSIDLLLAYMYVLKLRHLEVGYVQKLSVHSCKNGNESYSYYLKPSLRLQNTQPAEQLYGNITIELELRDGVPRQLKCTATYYSDANYREVRQSDEWFSVIFLREEFNL